MRSRCARDAFPYAFYARPKIRDMKGGCIANFRLEEDEENVLDPKTRFSSFKRFCLFKAQRCFFLRSKANNTRMFFRSFRPPSLQVAQSSRKITTFKFTVVRHALKEKKRNFSHPTARKKCSLNICAQLDPPHPLVKHCFILFYNPP